VRSEHRASYRLLLDANRGGGLYSEAVSQRLGALLALAGHRLGLPPAALSLANVLCGVTGSLLVLVTGWGAFGLVAWQLAYAFDCADGQLARVTGRAGPAGARLDVLCDLAVQISVVSAAASFLPAGTPGWVPALFAGTWLVNLVTSVLRSVSVGDSLLPGRSVAVRLVKLVRDYGFVVLVVGLAITFRPQWTLALVIALTALNAAFLLATLLLAVRLSVRAGPIRRDQDV
jgi:phosphatidylglycerophosphate synthase